MPVDFQRVAIVNRGEPAMRFIHAIREFNLERGTAIQTVALFTEPDRRARFVREADDSFDLGAATFVDPQDGQRKARYLDFERLEQAIVATQADAVWAGWGFVAERADFVELCDRLGVMFLGPSAVVMRRVGDKISAKRLAEQTGIPVVPWGGEAATSLDVAWVHAQRLGYPVLVKAAAGAGGRAIRVARTEADLPAAFNGARQEAGRMFGDSTVFVEQWLQGVRDIDVQVQCDQHGTAWAIGLRDCTVQRRFQKLIAEAPAPGLLAEDEEALKDAALRLCRAAEYRDGASIEFLFDPRTRGLRFLEVNPRLQVEHPVTELTTGLDLVKLSLHVLRGGRLEGDVPPTSGHAIEARLNAENVDAGFAAAPGEIELFRLPTGPGLRVDSGVAEGDVIPAEYGSMFAKLSTFGHTRDEALGRLKRALADSAIAVKGGTTNRTLLLQLLDREEVRTGAADVGWLDRSSAQADLGGETAGIALLQAAIEVHEAEAAEELGAFFSGAARMRPTVRPEVGRQVELGYMGHRYQFRVFRQGMHEYGIDVGGARIELHVDRQGQCERWITHADHRYHALSIVQGYTHLVEVDGIPYRISRADAGIVRAPGPAMVVSVNVKAGDRVSAGDRLAVLESMKMELAVTAPFSGVVRKVLVMANAQVGATTPLVHVDAGAGTDAGEPSTRVRFEGVALSAPRVERRVSRARAILRGVKAGLGELRRGPGSRISTALLSLRRLMLGFDVDPVEAKRLVSEYVRASQALDGVDADQRRAEDDLLRVFVDVSAVFARQAAESGETDGTLSAEEYLYAYLGTQDARGAELPRSFVEKLQRALSHYGVNSLEATPTLRESLLWMFKANRRADQRAAAVVAVLEQRLSRGDAAEAHGFLPLLDHLVAVSRSRFPAICDVARDVKYRAFDRPAFEEGRRVVYATMEAHLATLAREPFSAERQARIDALVECPQPLKELFAPRFEAAPPVVREVMLEVLTRRYYRIRQLGTFTSVQAGERSVAMSQYTVDERRVRLVATHAGEQELHRALETVERVILAFPREQDVVVDLHVWSTSPLEDADAASEQLRGLLNQLHFDRIVRRVVVMISGPAVVAASGRTQYFTFRQGADGFGEQKLYRGLHPMMAKRLEVWRLRNFFINRLASVEDVYLFHGVARDNPRDERLFAIAEVRDVTAIRDGEGRLIQIPHLQRVLMEALTAIRGVQLRRPQAERLQWNRVMLYVRPPLQFAREELEAIAHRLGAEAEGLGLQKVVLRARIPNEAGELCDTVLRVALSAGHGMALQFNEPTAEPIRPLTDYAQKVVRMRQRGLTYPYELVKMLTPSREAQGNLPAGVFREHDLDADGRLVPVDRPYGRNTANVVVGLVTNFTEKYPEGMTRVIVLGDPSKEVGSLAEPECARILAALDLAEQMRVPLEWFALSAGAKISMESGTENMDWIAKVLRRLIEFTQAGHEINIVIVGITVGGQPYWNAEATMLMHTRGILIMTPEGAMVLTGKTALDYSGSVSAEDNQGIGGYEHIMGPNGQAQYWARDIGDACRILLCHYDHTYIAAGERFPRRGVTRDPVGRDVCSYPHGDVAGTTFATVGEIFSNETNPGRKKAFDIRKVMRAASDQDHEPLERWAHMRDAENAVTWDAHIGGYPVALLGFESRPVPRVGIVPPDGPEQFTSGTLFPMASKKVARFVNAASGVRPLVILANLSGFDGSPESMRRRQLEFGAEIGRAVVNYKGPIVFCVISRYHGGAFVVFSKALNEHMEVVALEGSYASVIGGAPAAAVVFAREVDARARKDARVAALQRELDAAPDPAKAAVRARLFEVTRAVRSEKLGEVAEEFDRIHSVHRALQVGSLDRIIKAADLRPYLVDAIERGIARYLQSQAAAIV